MKKRIKRSLSFEGRLRYKVEVLDCFFAPKIQINQTFEKAA